MKAQHLGILSALTASVCCLGPVVLVLLGFGSLGFGAFLSRYHWWFIVAAVALLAVAWRSYLREAGRCRTAYCDMAGGRRARIALLLASMVVVVFVWLNLYTYASQQRTAPQDTARLTSGQLVSVGIPVEGMTCFTCELTVESSLKRLPGVQSAEANVKEGIAAVRYDPTRVSLDELIAAINKTGYHAKPPRER